MSLRDLMAKFEKRICRQRGIEIETGASVRQVGQSVGRLVGLSVSWSVSQSAGSLID